MMQGRLQHAPVFLFVCLFVISLLVVLKSGEMPCLL